MAEKIRKEGRSGTGCGSTCQKGGEQLWMVAPDKAPDHDTPCLWMQAGVVKSKECNHFYDCTTCRYDQGMGKKVEKGKQVSWQYAMRKRPELHRLCRHSLTGRIQHRLCAYDYQCGTCDFDQFFEDVLTLKTESRPPEHRRVRGFDVPFGYYYHQGHTWARIESGGCVRVGARD